MTVELCNGSGVRPVSPMNNSETKCPVCTFTTPVQKGRIKAHSKPTRVVDFKTGNRQTKIKVY